MIISLTGAYQNHINNASSHVDNLKKTKKNVQASKERYKILETFKQ